MSIEEVLCPCLENIPELSSIFQSRFFLGWCNTVIVSSYHNFISLQLEAAHEREKELIQDINDLQLR